MSDALSPGYTRASAGRTIATNGVWLARVTGLGTTAWMCNIVVPRVTGDFVFQDCPSLVPIQSANLLVYVAFAEGRNDYPIVLGVIPETTPPAGQSYYPPLIIADPPGALYPVIHFEAGDGNGSPTAYDMQMYLWDDTLSIEQMNGSGTPIAQFTRNSNQPEVSIGTDWWWQGSGDGVLRLFNGASRLAAEFAVDASGNVYSGAGVLAGSVVSGTAVTASGTVTGATVTSTGNVNGVTGYFSNAVQSPTIQATGAMVVRAVNYVHMQGNGSLGNPAIQFVVGNQYGIGDGPTAWIASYVNGNNYYQRPLTINKIGGAGECALGFANHVTGWTGAIQLYNTGANFFGFTNGANSAYIQCQALDFAEISARATKTGIRDDDNDSLDIITQLRPRKFRRQPERIAKFKQRTVTTVDDETGEETQSEETVPDGFEDSTEEQPERVGLVAEEVESYLPQALVETPFGPGLNYAVITATLVGAVQQLTARVAALEAQLSAT